MLKYEIYVPQNLNDGSPVAADVVADIEGAMEEMFGGFTHNPTVHRGVWVNADGRRFEDGICIYTLFTGDGRQVYALAKYVAVMLEQESVAVVTPSGMAEFVDFPTLAEVAS